VRKFNTASEMAKYLEAHIATLPARAERIPVELAVNVAPVLGLAIKALYGQNPPLADLAQSTQEQRVAAGFTANDPLLRSGSLRDSHESEASEGVAGAGNTDERSAWMEHGDPTHNRPPRPVHLYGLEATIPFAKLEMVAAARDLLG